MANKRYGYETGVRGIISTLEREVILAGR